jgi:dipeptidyl aminopeptidase/acylaminoacyl peptidase
VPLTLPRGHGRVRLRHVIGAHVLCLATTAMAGCGAPFWGGQPERPAATATPVGVSLPASAGYLFGLAWLRDGTLVASSSPDATPSTAQLWRLRPDGSGLRRLPMPFDRACSNDQYAFPTALADGRVALTRTCDALDGPPVSTAAVVAYDPGSGAFATLADLGGRMFPFATSWNPDLTRGVGAQSSHICAGVAWLTRDGPQGMPVTIAGGGRSWRLDAWLMQPAASGCTAQGRADDPAWSPDGRTIALLGSPESIGVAGQSRLDAPWSVYLLDVASLRARRVLGDLGGAAGLAWSPDGRWLAFTGEVSGRGDGLWLLSVATGALHLVGSRQGALSVPAWSPDGARLAAVEDVSQGWPPRTRIAIADVGALTAPR